MRFFYIYLAIGFLTGCSNGAIRSFTVEPELRQQLFTEQRGDRAGIACGTDHTGLAFALTLESNEIQIGYESFEVPVGARPRCRRELSTEYHGWVQFDLREFHSLNRRQGDAEFVSYILQGDVTPNPDNSECGPQPLIESAKPLGLWVLSRPPELITNESGSTPIPANDFLIDNESIPFREAAAEVPDIASRINLENSSIFTISASRIELLRRLRLTFISRENPDWKADSKCLMTFSNIRLLVNFRE